MPADPPPSAAGRARGAADAAQAHSFFSHLDTNIQRILAGFGTLRDLVTDVRASLADAAARDAQRAEDEEARDKAIAARLVDPAVRSEEHTSELQSLMRISYAVFCSK